MKNENLDSWKRGRISGHQTLAHEQHAEINKMQERIIKGMNQEEINRVSAAIDQLHIAVNAKFLRKCDTINSCETIKQVDKEVWSI